MCISAKLGLVWMVGLVAFASPTLADVAPLEARLMACLDAVERQDVSVLDEAGADFFGGEVVWSNGQAGDQSVSRLLSVAETRYSQRPTLSFVRHPETPEFVASAACIVYLAPEDEIGTAGQALRAEIVRRHGDIRAAETGVPVDVHYETCRDGGAAIRVVETLVGSNTNIYISDRPWIAAQCPATGE